MGNPKNETFVIRLIAAITIALVLFHLITAGLTMLTAFLQRGIHLTFVLVLSFLMMPLRKRDDGKISILDWFLSLLSLAVGLYITIFYKDILYRLGILTTTDIIVGWIIILLVLEQARRATGNVLVVIAGLAVLYPLVGNYIPGILGHRGYGFDRVASQMAMSLEGIFSAPLGVSAEYIVLFIFLSSLLGQCGMGEYLLKLALSIAGRFTGGPAKTAVLASSLFGTISGSAVANVAGTGTFTIPMMIKQGFPRHLAGAVEATASTGGQLMPPIMGAAAFIMAQILGVSYVTVLGAAIIPALLYYWSVFMGIHFHALKYKMSPLAPEDIPPFFKTLREGIHFLVPLALLVILLVVVRYTINKAIFYTIIATFIITYFNPKTRINWGKFKGACMDAAKNVLTVAGACAAAGLVVGSITMTGIGFKMFSLIMSLSGGILIVALIITMAASTVMGMGVPTTAAYIIVAVTAAPALMDMGISPLAAHMFVFYFAVLSAITPPVALAAFAAGGIAGESPMKIGWTAVGLTISAYVVPFAFIYNQALLGSAPFPEIMKVTTTAVIGVTAVAAAWTNYLFVRLGIIQRLLFVVGGFLVIIPEGMTDIYGLGCLIVGLIMNLVTRKKVRATSSIQQRG
ncbi:MAG: TRAP transporter permease [Deltaproteobacteria bacterium]|nr:TRAP transporter permease [Deltaproteobacteria bacterium]